MLNPKTIYFVKFSKTTFIIFFFILVVYGKHSNGEGNSANIVAILDMNTRMGKEQKTAMQIAVEDKFNISGSELNHNLSITFMEFNGNVLQTVLEAQTLMEEDKAQVIIMGMENWHLTTLVAQVGSQFQIPIISLASSSPITAQFTSLQWPSLLQMAHNDTKQIHTLATIIQAYHWRRVILVYEDDLSGNDYGMLSLLNKELQDIGSQIEDKIVLPSTRSTSDHKSVVQQVLTIFVNKNYYSRTFVVGKVSIPFVNYLFKEAKDMELMGNDSVWLISEHVTNLLPSLDKSTLLDMEGVVGIMKKFDKSTYEFELFQAQFSHDFPKEDDTEPGFHALLAFDTITSIRQPNNDGKLQDNLLRAILQCSFKGLSGRISFDQEHNTLRESSNTIIVNIDDGNYREICNLASKNIEDEKTIEEMTSNITWPGNLMGQFPKGWRMPSEKKVMRIGVPVGHGYSNFVHYSGNDIVNCSIIGNTSYKNEDFSGFCIALFRNVSQLLNYNLTYEFIPCLDEYNVLIDLVHNKTLDAVVGDVTILANRTDIIEFTLPFEEAGLSIILPTIESNYRGPWIFLRPFTLQMWLVTLAVLIYTMFIVWFLEHPQNDDFRGSWSTQLSTAAWFAFSSLYFAQRERISSGLARIVVVTWMFIVLVLTQSYTANLSSMLTNDRLNQTTIDIEMLKRSNANVGYDKTSFVNKFLEDLFQFNKSNIIGIEGGFQKFHEAFKNGTIKAAFIDVLYAELFVTQYCNQYTITVPRYRYGGLAYVFPKGSPITVDVSQAILTLTENGALMKLENEWLNTSNKCYINDDIPTYSNDQSSLSLKSFWVLFLFSIATTTICFLVSLFYTNSYGWMIPEESVASSN